MNNPHQNARTPVHSREFMAARRARGRPVAQIAEGLGVSLRTVDKWLRRFREDGRAALQNSVSEALSSLGQMLGRAADLWKLLISRQKLRSGQVRLVAEGAGEASHPDGSRGFAGETTDAVK